MSLPSRRRSLAISLLVILSMGLGSIAGTVHAAGSKGAAHTKAGKSSTTCAKRNPTKGTIKFSDWQFPDTLNPYQSSLLVTTEILHGFLEPLVQYDNHVKLQPVLLTRVPSVKNGDFTNGGKTVILRLKHGLRWSNGQEITSADVKFGWRIEMDPATGPSCSGTCDVVSRIDTPDKYTAVLHLKHAYAAAVPNAFPGYAWPTAWKGAWAKNDLKAAANKLGQDASFNFENSSFPTNGPYQISAFDQNNRIVLAPMKYYDVRSCGAYLKQLIFAFYSSSQGMVAAAANRETDVTFNYTAADVPTLLKYKKKFTTHVDPSFTFEHIELNVDKTYKGNPNPLGNSKVRQALALALDKYGLIRSALGLSQAQAKQIISWTPWVNTPSLVQPFTDKKINGQWDPIAKKYVVPGVGKALSDAKKLLSQTPFAGGFKLDFFSTSGKPVRQAQEAVMAASWARIGVTLIPNWIPTSKLFATYETGGIYSRGDFQVAMFAFTGPPDPDSLKLDLQSKYVDRDKTVHSVVNGNYSGVRDKIIDQAFNTAATSLNKATRAKAYAEVQRELNVQDYWIGLFFRPAIATDDGKVANFSTNPTTSPQWNVYNWRSKAA